MPEEKRGEEEEERNGTEQEKAGIGEERNMERGEYGQEDGYWKDK